MNEMRKKYQHDDLRTKMMKISKQLKEEAADIVRNTVPNYAYVSDTVRALRRLPLGTFMSFPSEILRTTTNIAQRALREIKDPALRNIGIKRLIGLGTVLTIAPNAIQSGFQGLYNVTNEELQALRQYLPEWSKNSTILPIRSDDGDLKYIDFSHGNAYDVATRPIQTLINEVQKGITDEEQLLPGVLRGMAQAAGELASPFISEAIYTEAALDIITRGGRTKEGRQLYTEQTPAGNKAAIRFLHLGIALAPSYRQFQRLGQAAFGTPTKRGDELNIGPELAGFMGLRPIKVDPLQSMGFKIAEYQTGIRNARREFTGGYFGILRGGRIKPNDVITAYYNSNRARFLVQQEMNKNITAAGILGVSPASLRREFRDRQISPLTFRNLAVGKFEPYYPSDDIQARFAEIARNLGDPNVFREVAPTLRSMRSLFRQLPLDGAFEVELDDYLFEEPGLIPLPETGQPVVNTPVNMQPTTQNTTLTRTEQALLSPSEQIIRERLRKPTGTA